MSNYIDHRVRSTYWTPLLCVLLALLLLLNACSQEDVSYENFKEKQISEALQHLEKGRVGRAEKLLLKLSRQYRGDRQVHVALATVYMSRAGISYKSFIGLVHSLNDFGNTEVRRRQQQNRRLIFRKLGKNLGFDTRREMDSFVNGLDAMDEFSIFLDHFLALPNLSVKGFQQSELAIRSLKASHKMKKGDYLLLGLLQATVFRFKLQHQKYIRHRDIRQKRTLLILNGYDRLLIDLKEMVGSFVFSSKKTPRHSGDVLALLDDHQQEYRRWRQNPQVNHDKLLISEFIIDWWCFRKYQRSCVANDHFQESDSGHLVEDLPEKAPWGESE